MMSIFAWLRKTTAANMSSRSSGLARHNSRLGFEQLEDRSLLAAADLVAFRPVTEFINHLNYPVAEAVETDPKLGPGIRVNGDDDNANGVRDFRENRTAAAG